MPLERRQRLAGPAEVREPRQLRHQTPQIGGNTEHHRSSRRLHHGQVAQELQRVAQALLYVEQDPRSVQRLALPLRPLEIARLVGRLPPPFIVPQTRRKVAPQQLQQRLVPARMGVLRVERDGALVARGSFVESAQQLQAQPRLLCAST